MSTEPSSGSASGSDDDARRARRREARRRNKEQAVYGACSRLNTRVSRLASESRLQHVRDMHKSQVSLQKTTKTKWMSERGGASPKACVTSEAEAPSHTLARLLSLRQAVALLVLALVAPPQSKWKHVRAASQALVEAQHQAVRRLEALSGTPKESARSCSRRWGTSCDARHRRADDVTAMLTARNVSVQLQGPRWSWEGRKRY